MGNIATAMKKYNAKVLNGKESIDPEQCNYQEDECPLW